MELNALWKEKKKSNKNNNFNGDIDFDRLFIPYEKNYYSLHKDIVYSRFLCIENLLDKVGNFIYVGETPYLSQFQNLIKSIYAYQKLFIIKFEIL